MYKKANTAFGTKAILESEIVAREGKMSSNISENAEFDFSQRR